MLRDAFTRRERVLPPRCGFLIDLLARKMQTNVSTVETCKNFLKRAKISFLDAAASVIYIYIYIFGCFVARLVILISPYVYHPAFSYPVTRS